MGVGKADLVFALTWQRNSEPVGARVNELLRWLSARLGRRIEPRVALSYEELLPMFRQGEVDVAWLPPVVYLRLRREGLARTLLVNDRHDAASYRAVLAVPRGSRRAGLADLQSTRIAWVDPWSASGYVLPRMALAAQGMDLAATFLEERFLGSHDAALRAVMDDRFEVAATFALRGPSGELVRAGWSAIEGASFDVLLDAGEVPSDVLAVRADMPAETAEALTRHLTAGIADPEGGALLRETLRATRFAREEPRYAALERELDDAVRRGLFPYF